MDPDTLAGLFKAIEKQSLAVDGVVVIRNGVIVAETYYGSNKQTTPHQLYSCTKSFISALIGIALESGDFPEGVRQPVLAFFPDKTFSNPDPRKAAMTLEHLLTMTSGLDWQEGDPIYQQMWQSRDWVKFVLDRPMADDPGADFNYNSGVSHVLSGIVQQGSGMLTQNFAQERLFTPLGINTPRWDKDADGLAIGGWGLTLTPRDMAKLGFLYLHGGVWDGQQIVPAAWVEASTMAHIETGGDLNYGYQWWIYPDGSGYTALGRYGQIIFVAPESDLVVVFTARIERGDAPLRDLIDKYILPAVQE
jgi:CubicO group peptidase (beta-lactamase class C family)